MSIFDDYKRHRDRYTRLKKRHALAGTIYESCPLCGKKMEPEMHHLFREKHDNRALPICRTCHDVFRDREQFEHPPLTENLGDYREVERRKVLGIRDLLELAAEELGKLGYSPTFAPGPRIVPDDDVEP